MELTPEAKEKLDSYQRQYVKPLQVFRDICDEYLQSQITEKGIGFFKRSSISGQDSIIDAKLLSDPNSIFPALMFNTIMEYNGLKISRSLLLSDEEDKKSALIADFIPPCIIDNPSALLGKNIGLNQQQIQKIGYANLAIHLLYQVDKWINKKPSYDVKGTKMIDITNLMTDFIQVTDTYYIGNNVFIKETGEVNLIPVRNEFVEKYYEVQDKARSPELFNNELYHGVGLNRSLTREYQENRDKDKGREKTAQTNVPIFNPQKNIASNKKNMGARRSGGRRR